MRAPASVTLRTAMQAVCLAAAVLALAAPAAPARADAAADCSQGVGGGTDWQRQRDGCAAVIRSGRWSQRVLAVAHSNRGWALNELGEHALALIDLDKAVALNPDYAKAYSNRGNAHAGLGDLKAAIADYDRALVRDPYLAVAYQSRGLAWNRLGKPERAVLDWLRAIKLEGAPRITAWQARLRRSGHYRGPVDGRWSEALDAALRACAYDITC